MAEVGNVRFVTPVTTLERKDYQVAQSALAPQTDNGISVTLSEVTIEEGEWVVIDASNEADLVGATSSPMAFMVFRGGRDRRDTVATGHVTVVRGQFEAYSKKYDSGGTYATGTALTAKNGQIEEALSGDYIIGHAYDAPAGGELHFHNFLAGGKLA